MKHNSFKRIAASAMAALLMGMGMPALVTGTQDTMLTAFADIRGGDNPSKPDNPNIVPAKLVSDRFDVSPECAGTVKEFFKDSKNVATGDMSAYVHCLEACANEGWNFASWTQGDGENVKQISYNSVLEYDNISDQDKKVTANFVKTSYPVFLESSPAHCKITYKSDTIMKDFEKFWTEWGSIVTIAVTPDADYAVKSVIINDAVIEPDADGLYTFITPMNNTLISVETESTKAPHPITIDTNIENCTITADKDSAREEEKVTLRTDLQERYQIQSIKINGTDVQTDENGQYFFIMPDEDVTVTAEIEAVANRTAVDDPNHFDIAPAEQYVPSVAVPSEPETPDKPNVPSVDVPFDPENPDVPSVSVSNPSELDEQDDIAPFDPQNSDETAVPSVIAPNPSESENLEKTDAPLVIAPNETKNANYADIDELCRMAQVDYEKTHSAAPANADAVENEDGTVTITLTDKDSKVLDVYKVDPSTAIGSDQAGNEVNLPQTGNFSKGAAVCTAAAVLAMIAGAFTVLKSGIIKKKDDQE